MENQYQEITNTIKEQPKEIKLRFKIPTNQIMLAFAAGLCAGLIITMMVVL